MPATYIVGEGQCDEVDVGTTDPHRAPVFIPVDTPLRGDSAPQPEKCLLRVRGNIAYTYTLIQSHAPSTECVFPVIPGRSVGVKDPE